MLSDEDAFRLASEIFEKTHAVAVTLRYELPAQDGWSLLPGKGAAEVIITPARLNGEKRYAFLREGRLIGSLPVSPPAA